MKRSQRSDSPIEMQRAVAIQLVRVAKYLAAHGYKIRDVSFAKAGGSGYLKFRTTRRHRVQVRVSDHPKTGRASLQAIERGDLLCLSCVKEWRSLRRKLRQYLIDAGPPLVAADDAALKANNDVR